VTPYEWSTVTLPLTEDAIAQFDEGEDQGAHRFEFSFFCRTSDAVTVDIDDWELTWELEGEALLEAQRALLDERYSDGGVTHFVGSEITLVSDQNHVNRLGPGYDLLVYPEEGTVSLATAVQFVHDTGGVATCNHPFGVALYNLEGEEAEVTLNTVLAAWLAEDGYGCDAVEVGYLARGLDLAHHMDLWDLLGLHGVFVTGIGSSDHHWATDWVEFTNPFLTWAFMDTPDQMGLAEEVRGGRVFFGNMGYFIDEEPLLDLWSEHGAVMGQVLESDLPQVIHVETGYVEPGWELVLLVNGVDQGWVLLEGTETDTVFELDPVEDLSVIRAEIRTAWDEPILLSNPLWVVGSEYEGAIPAERLAY